MESSKNEYIEKYLNPILHPLLAELLVHRPTDPVTFMINWLRNKYNILSPKESIEEVKFDEEIPKINLNEETSEEVNKEQKLPIKITEADNDSDNSSNEKTSPFVVIVEGEEYRNL